MVRSKTAYQVLTAIAVTFILLLGMFRDSIILHLNTYLDGFVTQLDLNWLAGILDSYRSQKSVVQWVSQYIIFYPVYLFCHFSLINIVFRDTELIRKWLNFGLLILLGMLISGKVIFGLLNLPILEEYFSFAFHKLVALPFLLLAIEGGRSIYNLIDERN